MLEKSLRKFPSIKRGSVLPRWYTLDFAVVFTECYCINVLYNISTTSECWLSSSSISLGFCILLLCTYQVLFRLCLRRRSPKTPILIIIAEKTGHFGSPKKKKTPKLGGLRRILPGGLFFRRFFIARLVIYTTKLPSSARSRPAGSAGLLRAAHPTPNTHTARARRVTGANVGSPPKSDFWRRHRFADFFFIRRMSPKKFFLHKTSSPFFFVWIAEKSGNKSPTEAEPSTIIVILLL